MRRLLFALPLSLLIFPARAEGPLFLELSARGDKVDVGLAEFSAKDGDYLLQAQSVRDVFKSDLSFPKTFKLVEGGGDPEEDKGAGPGGAGTAKGASPGAAGTAKAALSGWAAWGADLLVTGRVERSLGRVQFAGVLRDVSTGDVLLKKNFALDPGGERPVAHAFADEIVKFLTGRAGVFRSRLLFVNDATGNKEVCVMDYDGAGFRRLTNDRSIALFPKASPDGKRIVFTSFRDGWPAIQVMGADGASRRTLCRYEGLNAAAAWFPDGQSLVATLSLGRDPSLHIVDLQGKIVRTLTNANSAVADTAPSLSPDGLQLVFTSDRPGRPQIYLMNASGADIRRLTQTDGWCDSPVWSPLGNLVAFTMSEHGKNFDIYTIEPGTGRTERLTWGEGDNENAAWSPDGRWIAFTSSRRGRPELFVMGADGSNPRPVGDLPGRSFTPYWMN